MILIRTVTRRAFVLSWVCLLLTASGAGAAPAWRAPLDHLTLTRPFQPPPTPYALGHRGVDLAGFPGEPVLAAGAGDVSYAGLLAGRGVVVVIHGRLRTTYEPVTATVRRGAHVAAGEQIAFLSPGHPGCPSAACLHWGLLRGETYLDPLALLHRAVIRLLPLDGAPGHTSPALDANLRGAETTALLSPATHPLGSDARPSPVAWSLAALAGGGVVLAFRRR